MGRALKQSAKVKTNPIKDSVCQVDVPPVTFTDLWRSYPSSPPFIDSKTGKPPKGYENQCAIKVSSALHTVGVQMKSFSGASVVLNGKKAAVRAEEMAAWLKRLPFCGLPLSPMNATGSDWQVKVKGKKGIIFFANYWARDGEQRNVTGDHIDLWNGDRLTSTGFLGGLQTFARFTLGVRSGPGFSDLGRSTEILLWELT